MKEKSHMRNKQLRLLLPVFAAAFIAIFSALVTSGDAQVLIKPKVYKNPAIIPMPNLAITDLSEGNTPTSVMVQIGNTGSANAGPFYVKIFLRRPGSTTKTYVEKLVGGLKAKTDLPFYIGLGKPIAGLEIGIFIDSRNQIKEPDETNCGKMYPDGGVSGYMPCKDF
jgi:hypothetical protein